MQKEIIGDCILYHGDCYEVLTEIRDADCVITDPPYGCTHNEWDKPIDLDVFWSLAHKAAKINAAFCIFCQMPFAARLAMANIHNFRYDYVYQKVHPTGFLDAERKPLKAHELVYVFYRNKPVYNPQKSIGNPYVKRQRSMTTNYNMKNMERMAITNGGDRYPLSILPKGKQNRAILHPTEKNIETISLLIRTYTDKGHTVLDPFMGSGSTADAAVRIGRKFIGIEKEQKYFDTACKRIEQAISDLSLLQFAKQELTKKAETYSLL